jgi:hypothetical protein
MTQNLVEKAISNAKSSRNQKLSKNNFQALSARNEQSAKLLVDKAQEQATELWEVRVAAGSIIAAHYPLGSVAAPSRVPRM